MAKFECHITTNASRLANYLDSGIMNSALSVELVDSAVQQIGDVTVWLYMYDKYYMRNSSRAALTVQIIGTKNDTNVTAISAGGGTGTFFSFSYGAEENFVGVVENLIDQYTEA
ncbi:MAG: hypothetical protein IJF48_01225 [Clostridia bacterium]|nr:hypothetical protein [Clostridia bacterium]